MKKIILLFVSLLWGAMTALAFDQYERMAVGETKTFYFPTEVTSRSGTMYNYNCTSDYINNVEVLSYTKTSVTVKALKYTAYTVHIRFDYWWSENGYNRTDTHIVNIDLSDGSGPDTDPDTNPYNYYIDYGYWGTVSVKVGSTETVYCNYSIPYSDKLKSIIWSSKYSYGYEIVSQNISQCTIKGTSEMSGQKIWCLMKYGNSTYRAYYTVNVLPGDAVPDKISLPSSTSVKVGSTTTLSPTITPSNATTTLTWKSSNTSIATVSSSGVVKGVNPGNATITVTTSNGKSDSCVVTVIPVIPTGISIPESKTIKIGESAELSATLTPTNATASITWHTSDDNIATVSSSGVVKGVGEGTARIWAGASYKYESEEGYISSNYCYVYVKPIPTKLEFPFSSVEVEIGNTITLTPTITPSNASYTLTWSSSNTNVATVSSSGVVSGVNKGTAIITVKTNNGLSASCQLTVVEPQWRMFVWETSGQRIGYDLEDRPEVSLADDGTVTLTTARTVIQYEPATVEKLTLNDIVVDDITVGLDAVEQPRLHHAFQAGVLTFDGLEPGTLTALYDASGLTVAQTTADASGHARLSTHHLPTGVYIARAGKASLKISKR